MTPAKFTLVKPTGGRIGGLFLEETADGWIALLKSPGRIGPDVVLRFEQGKPDVRILAKLGGGRYRLAVADDRPADAVLQEVGEMPLPPYLDRPAEAADRERYQTVYSEKAGSVAAPTAGLHFTPELLERLDAAGIVRTTLTLHVGLGTFRPVQSETLAGHDMHAERYELPADCCAIINAAKAAGRRVVAVGTTVTRVLESQDPGELRAHRGETSIFIRPPYDWRHVEGLLTNFHLPRSTLIALVAAFVGIDPQRRLYAEAIASDYRFFSYGDASLLL